MVNALELFLNLVFAIPVDFFLLLQQLKLSLQIGESLGSLVSFFLPLTLFFVAVLAVSKFLEGSHFGIPVTFVLKLDKMHVSVLVITERDVALLANPRGLAIAVKTKIILSA